MPYKDKDLANASSIRSYNRGKEQDPLFLAKRAASARDISMSKPRNTLLRNVQKRARDRNIPFNLELSDIILPEVCPVFKTPFVYGTLQTASVDRIIPELGYVKGNIQIISHKANAMKLNASPEELKEFANWVISQSTS